jgi:hypothetical protein
MEDRKSSAMTACRKTNVPHLLSFLWRGGVVRVDKAGVLRATNHLSNQVYEGCLLEGATQVRVTQNGS